MTKPEAPYGINAAKIDITVRTSSGYRSCTTYRGEGTGPLLEALRELTIALTLSGAGDVAIETVSAMRERTDAHRALAAQ